MKPTKISTSLFSFFVLSLLLIIACNKDEEPVRYDSLDAFIEAKKPTGENFQISAATGGVLTTAKGSVITIPANAFVNQAGQAVTGTVNIRTKEIFSNADIMFSGVFPVSFGEVLNSGGEFFVQASQGGDEVLVKNGKVVEVEIPAQAVDSAMQLFLAGPIEQPADTQNVNWNVVDTFQWNNNVAGFTFSSTNHKYTITIDTLGWGNIDAFQSVSYFDCTFNLTGISGLDATNTTAFAVFKNKNTVWPVGYSYWGDIINGVITESHLANVPMNLIVISVVDGELYYGLLDVTPQQNVTYSIPMSKTTSAELDQVIENLP